MHMQRRALVVACIFSSGTWFGVVCFSFFGFCLTKASGTIGGLGKNMIGVSALELACHHVMFQVNKCAPPHAWFR